MTYCSAEGKLSRVDAGSDCQSLSNYFSQHSRQTVNINRKHLEYNSSAFGFQVTCAHFLDFAAIHLEPNERPEDLLFQRLMRSNGFSHHGEALQEDEEMTPTLENFVVLTWLRLIHPELPKLVKQRYGTELRSRTLASIKTEISQALPSLLDKIRASDDAKIMRTAASSLRQPSSYRRPQRQARQDKSCPLSKQAGRSNHSHFLSECNFLPEQDRKYIAKARQIVDILDVDNSDPIIENELNSDNDPEETKTSSLSALRVLTRQSPYFDTFYDHHTVHITINSGATGNTIPHSVVKRLGLPLAPSSQSAHQADGSSPLQIVGETRLLFTRDQRDFRFEGLVIETLDVDVLAGTPFMEKNDVAVRPAKRQVILSDGTCYTYGPCNIQPVNTTARRAMVLRTPPKSTVVWPGDFVEVTLPRAAPPDSDYALEPRIETPRVRSPATSDIWPPPGIVSSVAGKNCIPNLSCEPHSLTHNEHFCQVNLVYSPVTPSVPPCATTIPATSPQTASISTSVSLDPDKLFTPDMRTKFSALLEEYHSAFDPNFPGYNGAAGPFTAKVNMGPVEPPQRKERLPQYACDKLVELQQKFDELETIGVFKRPEDIDINCCQILPYNSLDNFDWTKNKAAVRFRLKCRSCAEP